MEGFAGPTRIVYSEINKCMIQSEYYSQCIPDTSSYSDVSTGCVAQYGRCSLTTKCCDPGAICTGYNQCVQPQTPDCVYPSGYSDGEAGKTFAEVPLQVCHAAYQRLWRNLFKLILIQITRLERVRSRISLKHLLLQAPPVYKGGAKKNWYSIRRRCSCRCR